MFAKVFSQIFDSSIAENYNDRHVFMDMLVLADSDGAVDMTREAISRRTNVPYDIVSKAIDSLMEPDTASRSHDADGRRIVLLDEHRQWGWRIVNYLHYRRILDEESRRAYFRDYRRKERAKKAAEGDSVQEVQPVQVGSTEFTQGVPSASSSESALKGKGGAGGKGEMSRAEIEDWVEKIRTAYPRKGSEQDCRYGIRTAIDAGRQTPQQIHEDVVKCAKWAKQAEEKGTCEFVPTAKSFFCERQWTEPEKFEGIAISVKKAQNVKPKIGDRQQGISKAF